MHSIRRTTSRIAGPGIGVALGDDHTGERPTRPRGAPPPDSKLTAYASDWDESWEALAQEGYTVTEDAIEVRCWDIWQGGERTAWVRRVTGDNLTKLLGKTGAVNNPHQEQRTITESTLRKLRQQAARKRPTWDEAATYVQLFVLGYVNYGVLVGIPKPVSLHKEDVAWAELLKRGFQTRVTTEGYRLAAARSEGGAQWFGVVPGTVAAVARELQILLLGETLASQMARDELRWAMQEPPGRVDQITGLVTNAMRFLAGYGIYLTVSTDRTVARVLDAAMEELSLIHI